MCSSVKNCVYYISNAYPFRFRSEKQGIVSEYMPENNTYYGKTAQMVDGVIKLPRRFPDPGISSRQGGLLMAGVDIRGGTNHNAKP